MAHSAAYLLGRFNTAAHSASDLFCSPDVQRTTLYRRAHACYSLPMPVTDYAVPELDSPAIAPYMTRNKIYELLAAKQVYPFTGHISYKRMVISK